MSAADQVVCLREGGEPTWRVFWRGAMLAPRFNSKGAASAFLDGLRKGRTPALTNHPNRSRRDDAPGRKPKPDEVVRAREAASMTQQQAAAVIYSNVRTWQAWEQGLRPMHPAFYELFLLKIGRRTLVQPGP